jgi:hypothetical protein
MALDFSGGEGLCPAQGGAFQEKQLVVSGIQ